MRKFSIREPNRPMSIAINVDHAEPPYEPGALGSYVYATFTGKPTAIANLPNWVSAGFDSTYSQERDHYSMTRRHRRMHAE